MKDGARVVYNSLSDIIIDSDLDLGIYSLVGYLKLDQTTPQEVINGAPHFNKGLIIKSGEKLIFDGA